MKALASTVLFSLRILRHWLLTGHAPKAKEVQVAHQLVGNAVHWSMVGNQELGLRIGVVHVVPDDRQDGSYVMSKIRLNFVSDEDWGVHSTKTEYPMQPVVGGA